MNASLAVVPRPQQSSRPDISWIKKNVPVLEVAKVLGLRIRHRRARCWRPENHTHGDADPSLHFHERRNRVRCFVCDIRGGHSNVDLVMGVLSMNVGEAVRWIAQRFAVPNVKPGRPVGRHKVEPTPYRVLINGSEFEVLVRSGMFGQLSAAERSILVALAIFRDPDSGLTTLSYQAIMRYSGVRSRPTVSHALTQLQRLRAIQISRGARSGITRKCSTYRVTLDDPKFYARCNEICKVAREEIAQERSYRSQLRATRERKTHPPLAAVKRVLGLNMTEAGGLRPPVPPFISLLSQSREHVSTCEGLNLSSTGELVANKAVPNLNPKIEVSEETRQQMLQRAGRRD